MAGDAGAGHRLQSFAVEIHPQLALAGRRREVVELCELDAVAVADAVRRILAGRAGGRAPFDRVGADVPLAVARDRGLDVETGVAAARNTRDVVVLDEERDAAVVGVHTPSHAPAVAEILHVAEDHLMLGAGAGVAGTSEAV